MIFKAGKIVYKTSTDDNLEKFYINLRRTGRISLEYVVLVAKRLSLQVRLCNTV